MKMKRLTAKLAAAGMALLIGLSALSGTNAFAAETSGVSTQNAASSTAELVTGAKITYPQNIRDDKNPGFTNWFHVNGKTAYCLQAHIDTPNSGTYSSQQLAQNENLQKVLYYGYGCEGDLTGQLLKGKTNEEKYIYTHIAASYAYAGENGFYGCDKTKLQNAGVMDFIQKLYQQKTPPEASLKLSKNKVKAAKSGNTQKTEALTLQGDSRNHVTLQVPAQVTAHNTTQGTSVSNGSIEINGNDSFYLSAELSVRGTYSSENLKGSLKEWTPLVIPTGNKTQMIGSYTLKDADPVSFSVKWTSKTELKKTDAVTGEEVEGAKLQILDQEKKIVEEWTSTKEAHIVYGLEAGTYTLHEELAPYKDGYVTAHDITFEVKDDGSVTQVDLKDEYSKVEISKTDITTGQELKGAKLQILNKQGKVLAEWVSDGKPHRVEKLPVNEKLTLRETAAPDGYEIAEDVTFTLKDTMEVQKVEMKDAKSEGPKTGDDFNIWMLAILCAVSGAVIAGLKLRKAR